MLLISESWPGNVHQTAYDMNRLDLSEYVVSIHFSGSNYSTVLLRVPNKKAMEVMGKMDKIFCMTDEAVSNWAEWISRDG